MKGMMNLYQYNEDAKNQMRCFSNDVCRPSTASTQTSTVSTAESIISKGCSYENLLHAAFKENFGHYLKFVPKDVEKCVKHMYKYGIEEAVEHFGEKMVVNARLVFLDSTPITLKKNHIYSFCSRYFSMNSSV